jgi:hypothetical protein
MEFISDKSLKSNLKNMGFKKVSVGVTKDFNKYLICWIKKSFKKQKGGDPVNAPEYYSSQDSLTHAAPIPDYTDMKVTAELVRPQIKASPSINQESLTDSHFIKKGGKSSEFSLTFKAVNSAMKSLPKSVICKLNKTIVLETKDKFEKHITGVLNSLNKEKLLSSAIIKKLAKDM